MWRRTALDPPRGAGTQVAQLPHLGAVVEAVIVRVGCLQTKELPGTKEFVDEQVKRITDIDSTVNVHIPATKLVRRPRLRTKSEHCRPTHKNAKTDRQTSALRHI